MGLLALLLTRSALGSPGVVFLSVAPFPAFMPLAGCAEAATEAEPEGLAFGFGLACKAREWEGEGVWFMACSLVLLLALESVGEGRWYVSPARNWAVSFCSG